jgi:hypothetical protein
MELPGTGTGLILVAPNRFFAHSVIPELTSRFDKAASIRQVSLPQEP